MGTFSWGRIAGLAGVAAATVGVVYLVRTERGQELVRQAREKGRELWLKARESAETTTQSLQESTQAALAPDTTVVEEQAAT